MALPAWSEPLIRRHGGAAGSAGAGKTGSAELAFARAGDGRTYLASQYFEYPFHVTRPFYLDDDWPELATLYLQSASVGVFKGDRLSL